MNQAPSDSEEQSESIDVTNTAEAPEAGYDDSDSSESSSSSGSSSNAATSSDDEGARPAARGETSPPADATLELAKIAGAVMPLPRGLCENAAIFREFFSLQTWRLLSPEVRAQLQTLLPRFDALFDNPAQAVAEQQRTLIMLLSGGDSVASSLQRFGRTPLSTLQSQLEQGNCRPDVVRLRQSIAKSRRRERRFQTSERVSQLAKQLFVSRERLLHAAFKATPAPPQTTPADERSERTLRRELPSLLYADTRLSAVRARKRYTAEVRDISVSLNLPTFSADEEADDDAELAAESLEEMESLAAASKNAAAASAFASSSTTTDKCIYGTLFKRRHDLATDEEALRTAQLAKQPRLSNRNFREYLLEHKRRKLTEPTLPDFETSDIRLRDVCARAQMGGNFKRIFATGKTPGRKPKSKQGNEPPALVPIVQPSPAATQLKNFNPEQQLHNEEATHYPYQFGMDSNYAMLQQQAQQQQLQMYLGRQNQTQQQTAEEYALVTENDNSDDENDQNEAFNMMDGEVELQQEEVETYGGGTCEETIPAFVISNDIVLPQVGGDRIQELQQQQHQQRMPMTTMWPQDVTQKIQDVTNPMPMYDASQNQVQPLQQITIGNLPKLEPFTTFNKTQHKEKLFPATTTSSSGHHPPSTASLKMSLNTMPATLAPFKNVPPPSAVSTTTLLVHPPTYSASVPTSTLTPASYIANPELIQETHACFFSLIRDFFCATPNHRMKFDDLKSKIDVWLCNPITALNDWYALAENWSARLTSAINFLAGDCAEQPEEYVPYIEHKTQLNIYQWIGAGRDTDTRLSALCHYWMQRRRSDLTDNRNSDLLRLGIGGSDQTSTAGAALLTHRRRSSSINELDDDASSAAVAAAASNYDAGGIVQPPPPPPRCPTVWTVRAATNEEIAEFQRQERERFEHPHRAYTYRMHNYESIVGPVKGIYSQILALTKARGHSMMIGDRPNFVTILTLVRDATARLPNGEGTRADISELLKCSQYINRDAAENVLQTIVSGALDRMHTEHDPCVRYDPKRKIWIYLHRNRSEGEFERMHQQYQGLGKHKKPPTATSRSKSSQKTTTTSKTSLTKDGGDVDSAAAVLDGVLLTERANVTSLPIVGTAALSVTVANVNTTATNFSLPALVPANPIIVNSQQHQTQQQKHLTQPQQQQSQTLTKSLPVPPLKYHNLPNPQQQQQKSLLKSTFQQVQRAAGAETTRTPEPSEHQNHLVLASVSAANSNNQRNQLRHISNAGGSNNVAPTTAVANTFSQPSHVNSVVGTAATPAKPYSFSVPLSKMATANVSSSFNAVTTSTTSTAPTTPIIVATPSGMHTVHVSNATTSAASQAQLSAGGSGTGLPTMQLQTPALSATVGGKKVALNKPIIINQITTQTWAKTKSPQIAKPQQQQPQSFFIPISGASNSPLTQTPRQVQTIFMDNVTQLVQATHHQQQQSSQQQAKNIIRLVPAMNNTQLKSLISSSSSNLTTSVVTTSSTSAATIAKQQHPPVHIIGQRVLTNATLRPQLQQQKAVGGVALTPTQASSTSSSGSAIVKMSAQSFASLQQKQGQHILLKQSASGQPQQQRVLVGNTAIIAQSTQGGAIKNLQQQQATAQKVVTLQKANATAAASSVGSQTSSPASFNISSSPVTAATISNKIQTINATNLTPQQQRVLLQNLKQQQQQIQFKTVQVVSNAQTQKHQQQSHGQHQQQLLRNQAVTIVPQRSSAAVQTPAQQSGKTVTVVVSQPQGTRLLKTTQQQQAQMPPHNTCVTPSTESSLVSTSPGTPRVLTNSTGQIISLESLLQKQGGALRITGSSSGGGGGIKSTQMTTTNLLQLATASASVSNSGQQSLKAPPHYAVVSQGRNIISLGASPHRLVTTQAIAGNMTKTTSTAARIATSSATATTASRIVSVASAQQQVLQGGGVITLPPQQQQVSNIGKAFGGKAMTTPSAGGSNIRVINAGGGGGGTSFSIANIQGKQVVFATKAATVGSAGMHVKTLNAANQSQQHLQSSIIVGGQTVKIQGNATNFHQQQQLVKGGGGMQSTAQMQTVIMGNQILRVQQMPQTTVKTSQQNRSITASATTGVAAAASNLNSNEAILNSNTVNLPKTLVLGSTGQAIRLQQPSSSTQATVATTPRNVVGGTTQHSAVGKTPPPASRVVLAVQGGGQIFLSPNFQGGTLNLKTLQNMKVVSLAQTTKEASPTQEKLTTTSTTTTTTATAIQKQLAQQSILKSGNGGGAGSSGGGGIN